MISLNKYYASVGLCICHRYSNHGTIKRVVNSNHFHSLYFRSCIQVLPIITSSVTDILNLKWDHLDISNPTDRHDRLEALYFTYHRKIEQNYG